MKEKPAIAISQWFKTHPRLYYWGPVVLICGILFYLSNQPTLPQPPFRVPFLDKWEHLVAYGGLGFFVYRAFRVSPHRTFSHYARWMTILFCFLYGMSDEFHQSFVPNRDASVYDLSMDVLGGVLGQWVASWRIMVKYFS